MTGRNLVKREDQWKFRRKLIFYTLIFCASCVIFILHKGLDLHVYETIATSAFALGGSVLGFYVAGRTWQDINVSRYGDKSPKEDQQSEAEKAQKTDSDES